MEYIFTTNTFLNLLFKTVKKKINIETLIIFLIKVNLGITDFIGTATKCVAERKALETVCNGPTGKLVRSQHQGPKSLPKQD